MEIDWWFLWRQRALYTEMSCLASTTFTNRMFRLVLGIKKPMIFPISGKIPSWVKYHNTQTSVIVRFFNQNDESGPFLFQGVFYSTALDMEMNCSVCRRLHFHINLIKGRIMFFSVRSISKVKGLTCCRTCDDNWIINWRWQVDGLVMWLDGCGCHRLALQELTTKRLLLVIGRYCPSVATNCGRHQSTGR